MQTFIPFSSFDACAAALDYRRLGKQRVEARQIITAITDPSYGWQHHPAVNMWRGFLDALKAYYNAICHEWERRGYRHNMGYYTVPDDYELPSWWGREDVHYSHRSMLWQKSPRDYYGWTGIAKVNYVWPI